MQKEHLVLNGMPIVGVKIRTSFNKEQNIETSRIKVLWEKYQRENLASGIPDRKDPGVTYCVYCEYEDGDHMGEYSCLIGEEVNSINSFPEHYEVVRVPQGDYIKFTTKAGKIQEVVKNGWQEIWDTPSKELGWRRSFNVDFDVYDERAKNPESAVVDIYLSVKPR
jgi:predicted transcriptional regulator YdeE